MSDNCQEYIDNETKIKRIVEPFDAFVSRKIEERREIGKSDGVGSRLEKKIDAVLKGKGNKTAVVGVGRFPIEENAKIHFISNKWHIGVSDVFGLLIEYGRQWADFFAIETNLQSRIDMLESMGKYVPIAKMADRSLYNGEIFFGKICKKKSFRLTEEESDTLEESCEKYNISKQDFIIWSLVCAIKNSYSINENFRGMHLEVDSRWRDDVKKWFDSKKQEYNQYIRDRMHSIISLYLKRYVDMNNKKDVDLKEIEELHKIIRSARQLKITREIVQDYRILLGEAGHSEKPEEDVTYHVSV